jgi:hypothetical protein
MYRDTRRKGKSHVAGVVPHTCVLGLPLKVKKFDSNRPFLTVWDCLTLLSHRVTSGI